MYTVTSSSNIINKITNITVFLDFLPNSAPHDVIGRAMRRFAWELSDLNMIRFNYNILIDIETTNTVATRHVFWSQNIPENALTTRAPTRTPLG